MSGVLSEFLLRRLLPGLLGALGGGVASAVLVMIFAISHWTVVVPVMIGGVVGFVGGDRGLLALLRIIGNSV